MSKSTHRIFRSLVRAVALSIASYAITCVVAVLIERSVVYQPLHGPETPQGARLVGYERQHFTAADGASVPYWEHRDDGPILLYFHGNGGGLYMFTQPLHWFARNGFHVIAMEYRGYPGAPPKPTEKKLIADAFALYDTVRTTHPDRKIVIWGYSLGSAVATQLAAARATDVLVLEAPFSATVDRAEQLFPFLPVHYLMRDQYRSREFIGKVRAPVFIMHGDADMIIPISLGKALFARANEPKVFREYKDAGHLDLMETSAYSDALGFIRAGIFAESP